MSAAVMSNYYFAPPAGQRFVADTRYPLQNWMFAQMAQYPPPPQPDQHHYNALYPTNAATQHLLNDQEQLQYSNLNQALYPKVETAATEQTSSNHQIHNLAQDLHQNVALNEQQGQHLRQTLHPPHQQNLHGQQSSNSQASQSSSHQGTPDQVQKANRLRKACDSCSIRKVKCDESGPPCRACTALDIPCTFERPSRRRGPPNRHAEALKRRRLDEANESTHVSPPTSPTHAAQALAALSSQASSQQISAESICSIETLDSLIEDFFTYIHPLYPFPHEPSFREAWKRREDVTNSSFLALLASMIGVFVSSLPRKPRLHLKTQRRAIPPSNSIGLVNRCLKVCTMSRGSGYLSNENLSVYDAATSYFMGLTSLYTFKWRQARLYFGECLTIIKTLGLHKSDDDAYPQLGRLPASLGSSEAADNADLGGITDNITLQMGRRIFWSLFVTIRGMRQCNAHFDELIIPPSTSSQPYPPLPAEVDDFCIYPTQNEEQPAGYVSLMAAFNTNISLYRSYDSLATVNLTWGIDNVVDWERQKRVLHESLKRCRASLDKLSANMQETMEFMQPHLSRDPAASLLNASDHDEDGQHAEERRQTQREVQRANVLVSGLSTRAYIVESYWKLREIHEKTTLSKTSSRTLSPGSSVTAAGLDTHNSKSPRNHNNVEQEMHQEREAIVQDVLTALSNISEVNMEPSADNFTMRLRALAGSLLSLPDSQKAQLMFKAQDDLASLLNDLTILEGDAAESDNEALRNHAWQDLQQRQAKLSGIGA